MAAKRLCVESETDQDQPDAKRIRIRPSFATIIGEVLRGKALQDLSLALEPLLRRVVNEEVDRGLRRSARFFSRSPSLRIQAPEPSKLRLVFSRRLSLPVYTGSKIEAVDNSPIQILLVDTQGDQMVPTTLPYQIKIEIVALDGDFPSGDRDDWTSEEFDKKIVRERMGKRPLLTGDLLVTMRDGSALVGDLSFTDNSSWIRSRKFRLGARAVAGTSQNLRIREAYSEQLIVKDHRGELYRKHYPPSLHDEVWRLEKIGKEGAFHRKLAFESIKTVQDFLKLWVVEPVRLRKILGIGMSDRTWEATIKHAKSCDLGAKLYLFRGPRFTVILNPICQAVGAIVNGQPFPLRDLTEIISKSQVESLVSEAHRRWNSLEVIDGMLNENALLPPGDVAVQYPNHQHSIPQSIARSNPQQGLLTDASFDMASLSANANEDYNAWQVNPAYINTQFESRTVYNMSDTSSDGDSTPSRAFYNML